MCPSGIHPLSTTPTCSLADTHPAGAMHRAPAQCFIYSLMRVAAIAIFRVGGHCGLHARASPLPRTKNNPPPVCTIIIAFTSHAKWANKRDSTVLRSRTQSGNNAITSSQPSSRVVARDDLTHCLSVVKLYCGTTERGLEGRQSESQPTGLYIGCFEAELSGIIWFVCVCVFVFGFVCLWVCYRDNSKLRASMFSKLGL